MNRPSSTLRPGDRVTVMGISSSLRVLQPLTNDMTTTAQAIQTTRAGGRTPLYVFIYSALNELGDQSSNANRDGAFRRLALRIAMPGVKWRTRSGYLAERDAVAGY